MRSSLHYDAVVVGAGVAGLTAAGRLAEGGARVCVLAHGVGSTHLAPGTIDVLGYDPERVESPARALSAFVDAHPEHPYALLGTEAIAPALEWFAELDAVLLRDYADAADAQDFHDRYLTARRALRQEAAS